MSMLLYPAFLSASAQFHLSRMVSLALCDVLRTLGIESRIKWPNDILSNKGKIAGILIEHSITAGKLTHSILGIGLNLNQAEFPDFPVPASSVRLESGKFSDVSEVGKLVETLLLSRYQELKGGMTEKLEQEYLDKLFKAGEPARFRTAAGILEGVIKGVNESGELLVVHEGEIRSYGHGTIHMEMEFDAT
jgi:BirA family biotin operon repressor/biotin-[acetyl-CoA-carboxylase] ligase